MRWVTERHAGVTIARPADWELLVRPKADAPLWAKLWPSAIALATHLRAARADQLAGARVVELGAGLALPSVVAQDLGTAAVLALDGDPDAVAAARGNGVPAGLHHFGEPLPGGPWDLVLAADVLHREQNVAPLLQTLPAGVPVLLADPARGTRLDAFEAQARERWPVVRRQALADDGTVLLELRPAAS